jgi:hypothetical protein
VTIVRTDFLLVTANFIHSVLIPFVQVMKVIHSTEMSVPTATRRLIPEYGLIHSQLRGKFKSHIALTSSVV